MAFTGLASQAAAPRTKKGAEYTPELNWGRPPYMASFRAGSFDFILLAAHIRWGESAKGRIPELQALADFVARRHDERYVDDHDLLVVGRSPGCTAAISRRGSATTRSCTSQST